MSKMLGSSDCSGDMNGVRCADGDVSNLVNFCKRPKLSPDEVPIHGSNICSGTSSLATEYPKVPMRNQPALPLSTLAKSNESFQTHHRNRSLDSALQQIPVHTAIVAPSSVQPLLNASCGVSQFVKGHHRVGSLGMAHRTHPTSQSPCPSSTDPRVTVVTCFNPYASNPTAVSSSPPILHGTNGNIAKDGFDRTSVGSDDSGICNSDDSDIHEHQQQPQQHPDEGQEFHNVLEEAHIQPMDVDHSEPESIESSVTITEMDVVDPSPKTCTEFLKPQNKVSRTSKNNNSGSSHLHGYIPPPKESWLLRLFESKMFDMSIAIMYIFNSKEPGVQTYLGKFDFALIIKIQDRGNRSISRIEKNVTFIKVRVIFKTRSEVEVAK